MSVYVLFGLPGAGKSFVGEVWREYFDCYFYDGDNDLTTEMQEAIATQAVITDAMRGDFFEKLIQSVKELTTKHENIIVAQTFIKEKYRKMLLNEIPDAKFIFIHTDASIRESRLANRIDYPLDKDYARIMSLNFERPKIAYQTIHNNIEGKDAIKQQITLLFGGR